MMPQLIRLIHHRWPSGLTYFFQMLESKDWLHDPIGKVSFVLYYNCVCCLILIVRLVGLIGLIWLNDCIGNSGHIGWQIGLDCLRLRHICWARLWVKDCVDKQDVINEEPKRRCHFFRPKRPLDGHFSEAAEKGFGMFMEVFFDG